MIYFVITKILEVIHVIHLNLFKLQKRGFRLGLCLSGEALKLISWPVCPIYSNFFLTLKNYLLVQSKFPSGILKERDCLFLCGLFFSFEGCNYLSCCKTIMYYPIWFFMNVHKFNFHIILSWEDDIQSYVASREEKFFV